MHIKNKIRQLAKRTRWKKITFTLVINFLLFWQTAIDYYYYLNFNFLFARRAFVKRTQQRAQQRVHWVGAQVAKPHRLPFILLGLLVLAGVFNAPHIHAALYWSIAWGSAFSLFILYRTTLRLVTYTQNALNQRTQN